MTYFIYVFSHVILIWLKLILWYDLLKATINGRTGVVVSGGINGKDRNMTSVEFYDTASGAWYTLPSLRWNIEFNELEIFSRYSTHKIGLP